MQDNIPKEKAEPAATETIRAFDLGKGSIGEAVRRGNEFLHKASLPWRDEVKRRRLIPAEFAETKTAAGRRRMWRTRLAHEAACAPQDADHVPETLDGIFCQRREHCLEPFHRPGQNRPAIHVLPHGRRRMMTASTPAIKRGGWQLP